jgi:aldehyde:ferredoxin oxidoreductase
MLQGYAGRILRVDLTTGMVKAEALDLGLALQTIGGRGMNSTRLSLELKKDIDPLSPENLLILSVGPLTGTLLSASAYFTFTAKSPLTGILGDSSAGGHFGPELKQAGYDQVIITGRSKRPSYLLITPGKVEVRDASDFWGKDIWETSSALRKRLRDPSVQIAAIGPAGEHLGKVRDHRLQQLRMWKDGDGLYHGIEESESHCGQEQEWSGGRSSKFLELCKKSTERSSPIRNLKRKPWDTMLMTDLNRSGSAHPTLSAGDLYCMDKVSGEKPRQRFKVKNKLVSTAMFTVPEYYVTRGEGEV